MSIRSILISAFALGLGSLCLFPAAQAQSPAENQAAVRKAQTILELVDDGKFGELWDRHLSPIYKESIPSREAFMAQFAFSRSPLGAIVNRDIINTDFADRDLATGLVIDIYGVNFRSTYQGGDFYERITVVRDDDGELRVGGMFSVPAQDQ